MTQKATNDGTVKAGKTYLDALVGESGSLEKGKDDSTKEISNGEKKNVGTPDDRTEKNDAPTEKTKNTASYLQKGFVMAAQLVENPLPVHVTKTSVASPPAQEIKEDIDFERCLTNLVVKAENNKSLFTDETTTSTIRNMFSQTKGHMSRTARLEERFFQTISENETLRPLTEMVFDGEGRKPKRLFYKLLGGPRNEDKKKMINMCLVVFGEKLRKEKSHGLEKKIEAARCDKEKENLSMYQPSTLGTMHRQLFANFRRNGIEFSQSDFKHGGAGTFHAYWKNKMAEAARYIDNYGRTPMRSSYDVDEEYKLRNSANPPWNLGEYNDILALLVWQMITSFMLRGALEVS